jgi:hypothetical protein
MGRIDPQAPLSEILKAHSNGKDSWNLMRVAPNHKFLGGSNQKKKNPLFPLECSLKKKRNFNMQTHKSETLLTLNVQSSITLALRDLLVQDLLNHLMATLVLQKLLHLAFLQNILLNAKWNKIYPP